MNFLQQAENALVQSLGLEVLLPIVIPQLLHIAVSEGETGLIRMLSLPQSTLDKIKVSGADEATVIAARDAFAKSVSDSLINLVDALAGQPEDYVANTSASTAAPPV